MNCDSRDFSRGFDQTCSEEYKSMLEWQKSNKQIIDLGEDYQVAGSTVGLIWGFLTKGLSVKQAAEMIEPFNNWIDEITLPEDLWSKFEVLLDDKIQKLKQQFFLIQSSNSGKKVAGAVSKALIFVGNSLTGGLLGEAKTAFEILFSALSKAAEQATAPRNFEDLCFQLIACLSFQQLLEELKLKRIYFPLKGTRQTKAYLWYAFCLTVMRGESIREKDLHVFKTDWEHQINLSIGEMEKLINEK